MRSRAEDTVRTRKEVVVNDVDRAALVVRPCLRRAVFGEQLAGWLEEGVAAHRALERVCEGAAALVLVPEYLHAGARGVLADLARRDWSGTVVAVVGYGGRTRGRYAIADARLVLDAAGAQVLGASLGIDTARVRAAGFEPADVLLRDLLLDAVAGGPVSTNPCHRAD